MTKLLIKPLPLTILEFCFNTENSLESTSFLSALFAIKQDKLNNYIKGWIMSNLTLEDLGQYFYKEGDFDQQGEWIGSGNFLSYNADLDLMIGAFFNEFLAVCEEAGEYTRSLFNSVIIGAVIDYKNLLN